MTIYNMPRGTVEKRSGFVGDVLKLVSGTTFAQAVSVLAAPVLTRFYAPEAFGILALFISITGILGVIACMRYELAIMLPERDEEAANLLGVSLGTTFLLAIILFPLILWLHGPLVKWLNSPALGAYLWLVPLTVLIHGVFLALNYWNSRMRRFWQLSSTCVASSLTTTSLSLGLGFAGHVAAGSMICANITGQAVAMSVLGGSVWRDDRKVFLRAISWQSMKEGIKRYKKFPLFDSVSALLNTISAQLAPLLLAVFFSSTVVGFYSLGFRLLSIPLTLIGGSIAQVFLQRAAMAKNDGSLPLLVSSTFIRLVALGLFPMLLIMTTGANIFSVVFGSRWTEAGVYAQILSPWFLFVFVGSPISALFTILEKQESFLLFNTVLLAARIISLVMGGLSNSILFALSLYAGTGSIMWICLCVYLLKKANVQIRVLITGGLKPALFALITLSPVVVIKLFGVNDLYVLAAGCLAGILYYIAFYCQDKELQNVVGGYIGKLFRMG